MAKNLSELKGDYGFQYMELNCTDCFSKSNMIAFGTSATMDDIEIIARRLIESDAEIQVIRRFKDSSARENIIQIGFQEGSDCTIWTKQDAESISLIKDLNETNMAKNKLVVRHAKT